MKYLILLCIVLLNCPTVIAQQEAISDVFDINLPKKEKRVSQIDAENFSRSQFSKTPAMLPNDKVYEVDSMLVVFRNLDRSISKNPNLESLKMEFEDVFKSVPGRLKNSRIVKVNGIDFYIIQVMDEKEGEFHFYSEYKSKKTFSGHITFKLTDEEKAKQHLQMLLKSVHPKK